MNTDKILNELIQYYSINRQVGHTFTTINGIHSSDKTSILIVGKNVEKSNSSFPQNVKVFSLYDIENNALRGLTGYPLVIDNNALILLFNAIIINANNKNQNIKDMLLDIIRTVYE